MKTFTLKLALTLVVALLFFSCKSNTKATAEEIIQERVHRIDTVSFTMDENFPKAGVKYNTIYIPVQLKDSASYSFMLDNCFRQASFRDNVFNTMYDISDFRAIDTPSVSAARIRFEGQTELKIGTYLLSLDTISIINTERLEKFYPTTSEKGIIGSALFEREIVEIDFDNHLVLIHSHLPEKTASYLMLDLVYNKQSFQWSWSERMPRIQLEGFVGKNQEQLTGRFIFDLGSQITQLFSEFKAKLSSDMSQYDSLSWGYRLLNLTGAHNITTKFIGSDNADISLPLEDEYNQGHIGMDFLKQFNLVFDFPRGKIYLQPRENAQPSPYLIFRK